MEGGSECKVLIYLGAFTKLGKWVGGGVGIVKSKSIFDRLTNKLINFDKKLINRVREIEGLSVEISPNCGISEFRSTFLR